MKSQACLRYWLYRQSSTDEWRTMLSDWLLQLTPLQGLEVADLNALFHHQVDGKPAIGVPCFRFHSAANTGRIYAIGDDAVDRMYRIAKVIGKLESPGLWLHPPELVTENVNITLSEKVVRYNTNDLVICRDAEQYKRWGNSSQKSRFLHVQDIIKRGLQRQVDALGMSFEVPSPAVLSVSHERAVHKLKHPSHTKVLVRLASVVFTLPVVLDGHWVAGGLINRGYGLIVSV